MDATSETLRLRTLGGLALEGPASPVAESVLQGPKRTALLVYLASAPPGAFVRRDSLLPLFWPDLDQARGRHALRNALYEIRRGFGPDVVEGRGKEEIALAPGAMSLDVAAFDAALAEGRPEEAVELYLGEFLAGFHATGVAPELEHWIDAERERLGRKLAAALEQIADSRDAAGQPVEASRAWRRLVRRDPIRERFVVRLMESLVAAGDRGGALREARAYIDHMRNGFDAEPAPRVAALARELKRWSSAGGEDGRPARVPHDVGTRDTTTTAQTVAAVASATLPLVGREAEWAQILTAWRAAEGGRAGLLAIEGVAGVGKTRLAEELLVRTARRGVTVATGRCYDSEGRLAYGPIAEWLRSGPFREALRGLEPVWRTEIARVLPDLLAEEPGLRPPKPLAESWQRRQFFESLARGLRAAHEPIALLLDDLQWADPGTLEWLRFLLHDAPHARLLIVATVRDEEPAADHPWHRLRLALLESGQLTELRLRPLRRGETAALAGHVAGRDLTGPEAEWVFSETEGNPLFVVETVRSGILEAGPLGPGIPPALRPRGLTPRVKAVIQRRLEALSPGAREVAEVAAVIGQPFHPGLVEQVTGGDGDSSGAAALDELRLRRILEEKTPDALAFSHDKLREVTYGEIGPARTRLLHRRVALALARLSGPQLDAVRGRLAAQYERGGMVEEAIAEYERAANVARSAHAHEEAVRLLARALELLTREPAGAARDERESRLRLALGVAAVAVKGWSNDQSHEAFRRYVELRGDDLTSGLVTAMWGLQAYPGVRGDMRRAAEVTETFAATAERAGHAEALRVCRFNLAFNAFHVGDMPRARELLELVTADPGFRAHRLHAVTFPLGVLTLCYRAHVSWHLGDETAATRSVEEASVLAEEAGGSPFEQAVALAYDGMLHVFRDEPGPARAAAEAAIALCERHGVRYYRALAGLVRGWAIGATSDPEAGLAEMRRELPALRATGSDLRSPWYLGLMARLEGRAGRIGTGRKLVAGAISIARSRDELWCEPELHHIDAELLARKGAHDEAERALRRAIETARTQGSVAVAARAETALRALAERARAG